MVTRKLKEFLDAHRVKYITLTHSPAFTAQEIAQSAHVSGREMAKTVIVALDGRMVMAVLPASHRVDLETLRAAAGAKSVMLASEEEFKYRFPDSEIGAMPPFGNLYGVDVLAAESLMADREMVFNAGSHSELIRMSVADFARLVHPRVLSFSVKAAA